MAAPVIGIRPRYAPPLGARVDPTHPLAASLEFCFIPAFGDRELARGYIASRTGTPAQNSTSFGPSMTTTGTATQYVFSGVPDAPFLGALSVMWIGKPTAASGYNHIGGKPYDASNKTTPFNVYGQLGASNAFTLLRGNATSYWSVSVVPSGGVVTNRDYVFIATAPDTATAASGVAWCNGTYSTTTQNLTSGAFTGLGQAFTVGFRPGDNLQSSASTSIFAVWSRRLALAEIHRLNADPFCFLKY